MHSTPAATCRAWRQTRKSVARYLSGVVTVLWLLAGGSGVRAQPTTGEQSASIDLGTADGYPGQVVRIEARLSTGGAMVAAAQNDIAFPASAAIAATVDGLPDCVVNPAI